MGLTLYYSPMSTATLTQVVLEELGVPYEKVKLDLSKGEAGTSEFKQLNPNGKVPCVVHDGVPLWESAALTMYLGETFGVERGLYPPPGTRRGEAMMWVAWTNVTLGDAVQRFARNTMEWMPVEQRNAAAGEQARQDIAGLLAVLDGHLAGRQFLCGEFTLADSHLNGICDWMKFLKLDVTPFANVVAWNQRCGARAAYQRVMSGS